MSKRFTPKYAISDERLLEHVAYLADLASLDSIAAVARHRGMSWEAVVYHLNILNDELGRVYEKSPGGKVRLTERGCQLLAMASPVTKTFEEFSSWVRSTKGLKLHWGCPNPFPSRAKVFSGTDLFPGVKSLRRKLVIQCLLCETRVMVLLRSCVREWLKLHNANIYGPQPSFKVIHVADDPTVLRC